MLGKGAKHLGFARCEDDPIKRVESFVERKWDQKFRACDQVDCNTLVHDAMKRRKNLSSISIESAIDA